MRRGKIKRLAVFLLGKGDDFGGLFCDAGIVLFSMRNEASGAILDAVGSIGEIAAAVFSQGI